MDLGYAEYMSLKEEAEREAFGPRPQPKKKHNYETKWRTERALAEKVLAIAKAEGFAAEFENPTVGSTTEISLNAQLNFIVEGFVKTYEKKFGPVPSAKDDVGLKRYARNRSSTNK